MIPHRTTPEQGIEAAGIATRMAASGLDAAFVVQVLSLALWDQGLFDLIALWRDAEDEAERAELVADLHEAVEEAEPARPGPEERPKVPYEDLGRVAGDIMAFKARLRDLIDRQGGVTEVARRAGIPQPSLSRMLNSASMPRRTTLYRIARALDLPESAVATEWTR